MQMAAWRREVMVGRAVRTQLGVDSSKWGRSDLQHRRKSILEEIMFPGFDRQGQWLAQAH